MSRRMVVAVVVLALSGLPVLAAPANASCNEVGDPSCTVQGWTNAALCTANEVASGAPNKQDLADCFTQTTGSPGGNADTNVKEKVQCMFRQYIQEGGESGLDCLT